MGAGESVFARWAGPGGDAIPGAEIENDARLRGACRLSRFGGEGEMAAAKAAIGAEFCDAVAAGIFAESDAADSGNKSGCGFWAAGRMADACEIQT